MNWSMFIKILLRNILIGIVASAVFLGALGYFLAGRVGMENGATWGAILGFFGGLMSVRGMYFPLFWGWYANRYGKEQFRQESEGDGSWPRPKP